MTLEEKINICLEFIATTDMKRLPELKALAAQALKEHTTEPVFVYTRSLLDELGVPMHCPKGYRALIEAISLVVKDRSYISRMGAGLYPAVAEILWTYPENVSRNIGYAVTRTFEDGDINKLSAMFGDVMRESTGTPTPTSFIERCAGEVARRMKEDRK